MPLKCNFVSKLKFMLAMLLLAISTFTITACNAAEQTNTSSSATLTSTVSRDSKFDSAVLTLSAEDFKQAGFSLGDSCDIAFSNGYTLTDVPYYNGYYVKKGNPVVVAYPNNDYVLIANNNADFWTPAGLDNNCTVEITLNTPAKYSSTQEALGQSYSVERLDYSSDEEFSNFRALSGGKLKSNFLYRGASPLDNSRARAAITNSLLEKANIQCVIDLADTQSEIDEYIASENFSSFYTKTLYEKGRIALLSMSSDYDSDSYKAGVAKGVRHLLKYSGPAYIHCMEGKDRTGFVCLCIEGLAGANYEEMRDDYMTTYANYYGITQDKTPERYDAVVSLYFDSFLEYLSGISSDDKDQLKAYDYSQPVKDYLLKCGLSDTEINQLLDLITE